MAHHIYTTEAFVLEGTPGRESNKVYVLFTKDLGMLRASAQGVRLITSKLRYSLQDFSRVTLSVVRGKEFWRITSAVGQDNIFTRHQANKELIYALARIFRLLKRLVPSEEKNEALFDMLKNACEFIDQTDVSGKDARSFEYILVLRILDDLGYLAAVPELKQFLSETWNQDMLAAMNESSKIAVAEINKSLRETQL